MPPGVAIEIPGGDYGVTRTASGLAHILDDPPDLAGFDMAAPRDMAVPQDLSAVADLGAPSGTDAGPSVDPGHGCGCSVGAAPSRAPLGVMLLLAFALLAHRRRRVERSR
jgi:MYXO-CTERM domain-containing protein